MTTLEATFFHSSRGWYETKAASALLSEYTAVGLYQQQQTAVRSVSSAIFGL